MGFSGWSTFSLASGAKLVNFYVSEHADHLTEHRRLTQGQLLARPGATPVSGHRVKHPQLIQWKIFHSSPHRYYSESYLLCKLCICLILTTCYATNPADFVLPGLLRLSVQDRPGRPGALVALLTFSNRFQFPGRAGRSCRCVPAQRRTGPGANHRLNHPGGKRPLYLQTDCRRQCPE